MAPTGDTMRNRIAHDAGAASMDRENSYTTWRSPAALAAVIERTLRATHGLQFDLAIMLKALAKLLTPAAQPDHAPGIEQHALHVAVATLLFEVARMDFEVKTEDLGAARAALAEMFGLDAARADVLLHEAGKTAHRITSYFAQVSVINRRLSMEQRLLLVEHLWRVAYADRGLDPYEDHFVRKIMHLLYVPHVQGMLARQRAREAHGR